ncbi:MAG TPA: GNAT family N-acetyltransferase [bacterium]|nr:GNAT family N-acetyltransferase [bacterium]
MKGRSPYRLTDHLKRMDFSRIHGWLKNSYWVSGISKKEVMRAIKNSSLVVGAFDRQGNQAGFLRVVSDKTRFAYLMDVFVDPAHRGKGLAKAMVRFVFKHPDFKTVKQWLLATRDAQNVYRPLGFKPLKHPKRWMARVRPWKAHS